MATHFSLIIVPIKCVLTSWRLSMGDFHDLAMVNLVALNSNQSFFRWVQGILLIQVAAAGSCFGAVTKWHKITLASSLLCIVTPWYRVWPVPISPLLIFASSLLTHFPLFYCSPSFSIKYGTWTLNFPIYPGKQILQTIAKCRLLLTIHCLYDISF